MSNEIYEAWIEAGSPQSFATFRDGYNEGVKSVTQTPNPHKFKCACCNGRGRYDDPPYGIVICSECRGSGFIMRSVA